MPWFIGIVLLLVIILIMISYIKKRKIYKIVISVILIAFFIYSFFTYNGAVRLGILFVAKNPLDAYTSEIKESTSRGNDNRYFTTKKEIPLENNSMADLECDNYLIVKVCTYYGF